MLDRPAQPAAMASESEEIIAGIFHASRAAAKRARRRQPGQDRLNAIVLRRAWEEWRLEDGATRDAYERALD